MWKAGDFESVPKVSGVYEISCSANGFVYYGSTGRSLRSRFNQHTNDLRGGKHTSAAMQNDWDRFGEDAFTFKILEFCPKDQCLAREQVWIDKRGVGPENKSYNYLANVGAGKKRAKGKLPADVLERRSKHKGSIELDESATQGDRIAAANSLEYVVTSPDGVEQRIKNLAKFCRENGLSATQMVNAASGRAPIHKGWKCRYPFESREQQEERINVYLKKVKRRNIYIVTTPAGEEIEVHNLLKFCKERGFQHSAFTRLARGEGATAYKGWLCRWKYETEEEKAKRSQAKSKHREYVITHPDGTVEVTKYMREFCLRHNLDHSTLLKVARGVNSHHKGFKCKRVASDG